MTAERPATREWSGVRLDLAIVAGSVADMVKALRVVARDFTKNGTPAASPFVYGQSGPEWVFEAKLKRGGGR